MVGLVVMALVAVAGPRATAAEGDLTGFVVPTPSASPHGVARGSDDAIWFTERSAGKIGRLEGGAFTEYALQTGFDPTAIVSGPDGNLWFTEQAADQIGRISTTGALDEFALNVTPSTPSSIAVGPDGAMWFTERAASRIGRISLDGLTLDEWPTLTSNATPNAITLGPDGAMWFTERNVAKLGRIEADGTMSEFPLPPLSSPRGIVAGPDGNLWITLFGRDSIARVTTAGVLDAEFLLTVGAGASHIVSGPQGALWFTESAVDKVGRITTAGVITEYPLAAGASPQGIAEGADGVPWFAEAGANRIARLDLGGGPVDTTPPTIEIHSPLTGTPFVLGQRSPSDYECVDEPGGSTVAICDGPVLDGQPVPTGALGEHTFAVHAEDVAGNPTDAATHYLVFRWIGGNLVEPSPRPGAWLTLTLGMDLDPHGPEPLASAMAQQVSCADGSAIGAPTVEPVRTRVAHDGGFELRWRTDRAWGGTCRTLTLNFSAPDWDGAPATFLASFVSAARARR